MLPAATGAAPGLAAPWGSWALRIGEALDLGDGAAIAALAVVAVAIPALEGAPDPLARGTLAARLLGVVAGARAERWLLDIGAHAPAIARVNPPEATRAAVAWGARESVALWMAPASAAGLPTEAWARFGERVAQLVGVLESLGRLWLDPEDAELERASYTPLLASWLGEPALSPAVLRAYAGDRASPARRFEIRSLAASRPLRDHVAGAAARGIAHARAALSGPALSGLGEGFLEMLEQRFRFYGAVMEARDLLSVAAPAPPWSAEAAAAADVAAAVDLLRESAPWVGSWEVQRFGVRGSRERPIGQWFVRGLILQALAEMGHEDRPAIQALLAEIPEGGLRYFGDFREIPPDADDLGLMLQLAASVGQRGSLVESWIAPMVASVDEGGTVPTWFYREPGGPTVADPPGTWAGDDCTAVRLNLLMGLIAYDAGRFDDLIRSNAARVLACHADGVLGGTYYYDDAMTALLFLRFARMYREAGCAGLGPAVSAAESAIGRRLAAAQRLDGGWGSPQRTAAFLEGLTLGSAPPDPLALARAMRYLGEAQLADGAWPAEPLYRTPLKAARVGHHQGRELTTALCARALERARVALAQGAPRSAKAEA